MLNIRRVEKKHSFFNADRYVNSNPIFFRYREIYFLFIFKLPAASAGPVGEREAD